MISRSSRCTAASAIERLDIDDPDLCLRLFKSNRDAGLILFAALIGDALYANGFF